MDYKNLKTLIAAGCTNTASANFSAEDANSAAINAICEQFGLTSESTIYDIRSNREAIMSVIDETINEILPRKLEDICGRFSEIKSFGRGDEIVFSIKNKGLRRQKLAITKGTRSGVYRVRRLDAEHMQLPTYTYTVGTYVTLEEILLGRFSLGQLFSNILEGFQEIMYREVVNALYNAADVAPGNNKIVVSSSLILNDAMDKAIIGAKAYGMPLIVGFRSELSKLVNIDTVSINDTKLYPNVSHDDLNDIRQYGIIRLYKGVEILELPNFFKDELNDFDDMWFKEDRIFILPVDAKPVKVALRGELVTVEEKNDVGSEKWNSSKMMGVGVLLANNVFTVLAEGE